MECKVSDLVKRGHDQSAELKASCGAVDVRDVAQLISDLATQLDVQLARSNALAAENAGLKAFGDKLYSMYKGLDTSGGGFHDEQSIPYQQAAIDAAISAFEEIKTPETDASMAELRAQGVDAAIEELNQLAERSEKEVPIAAEHHRSAALYLQLLATQLRKGVQS
ncbi:hypothetical protein ACS6GG_17250 [Enterobacter bugandensis]|uniref:hypothetical protein n=1 Tax=Enterobacter bugandensis TaxID=881260 RepID=UPI003F41C848